MITKLWLFALYPPLSLWKINKEKPCINNKPLPN